MRRIALAVLAAGIVVSAIPAAYAAPSPTGVLCGFTSASDPQVEGSQTGEIDGGPVFWTDDTDPTVTYTGSITCTIQVNAPTHAGPDSCSVTGPETPVVGEVAGTCTYAAASGDNVYLCTQVDVGGTTLYFADPNDPLVDGAWSTDPNVPCGLATTIEPVPSCEGPVNICDDATCEGLVNICTDAPSCTGGGVNVCPGSPVCEGLVNLCTKADGLHEDMLSDQWDGGATAVATRT